MGINRKIKKVVQNTKMHESENFLISFVIVTDSFYKRVLQSIQLKNQKITCICHTYFMMSHKHRNNTWIYIQADQ